MSRITRSLWGTHENRDIHRFAFANRSGMTAEILNLGGILASLRVPGRNGVLADVVLGFDTPGEYLKPHPFFGALVGRYANRIAGSEFTLNGITYPLVPSEGKNHIHGGTCGFDKKIWDSAIVTGPEGDSLVLSYYSRDGEQGYPGNLDVTVTYTLSDADALTIAYSARSDKDTVVNLTNHSYFNLAGHDSGNMLDQTLRIRASRFTVVGEGSIPTGELRPVAGTPLDFTAPAAIGARIEDPEPQLLLVKGYDHNYAIDPEGMLPSACAEACDPVSGRVMTVYTDMPGVQLYTGNFLNGTPGKDGCLYGRRAGFCLETQFFPDSVHHGEFPSAVLKAHEQYSHVTTFAFSLRG
jgi:aldose 1-epimerase